MLSGFGDGGGGGSNDKGGGEGSRSDDGGGMNSDGGEGCDVFGSVSKKGDADTENGGGGNSIDASGGGGSCRRRPNIGNDEDRDIGGNSGSNNIRGTISMS